MSDYAWMCLNLSEWFLFYTLFFLIRTSKFCLGLAVLNFFFFFIFGAEMFLICSYFPNWTLQCTEENVRLNTIKTHYFISFILFLSSSAHRQPLGGVLQKIGSATVLKPIKKYCEGVQFVIKVAGFMSVTLLKLNSFRVIFHRFWTKMQLYTL